MLAGTQRVFDAFDHLLERVGSGTKTQLGARDLARTGLTADRDLGDLGCLEYAFDELTAVAFVRVREQEAAFEVNSPLGWKTDGKIHGCSWYRARRREVAS